MRIPFTLAVSLFAAVAQAQVWVQQGPGPNTGGQVEGITNKKVVGAVTSARSTPARRLQARCVRRVVLQLTSGVTPCRCGR